MPIFTTGSIFIEMRSEFTQMQANELCFLNVIYDTGKTNKTLSKKKIL